MTTYLTSLPASGETPRVTGSRELIHGEPESSAEGRARHRGRSGDGSPGLQVGGGAA